MQEKGVIQWYYNKWWTPETAGKDDLYQCNREYKKQDSKASALGVDSIGKFVLNVLYRTSLQR